MRPKGIHHVALRVADVPRSAAFYSGVLGFQQTRQKDLDGAPVAVWLDTGGAILMLERRLAGAGETEGSGHLLAFRVEDLSSWEAHLALLGVPIVDRTPFTLYLQDPDGHRVGLSTYEP
jgi:catechol 2,3-dioxygenase-like lactoylglutathione lyase family enzyme